MLRTFLALTAIWMLSVPGLNAEDVLPAEIAPYVDEQTVSVGRIDLGKIDLDDAFKKLEAIGGKSDRMPVLKQNAEAILADLKKAGARHVYLTFNMADFSGNPTCIIVPLPAGADADKVLKLQNIPGVSALRYEAKNGTQIFADEAVIARIKTMKPAVRPDLAAALAQGKDAMAHVAVTLPSDLRRVLEETMPKLPKEIGGGSIEPLSRGLLWLQAGLDIAPKLHLTITAKGADAKAAGKLHELLKSALELIARKNPDKDEQQLASVAKALLAGATVDGDRVVLVLDDAKIQGFLKEFVQPARDAARRSASSNNLKQILLALHNYHEVYGRLPVDVQDKDGKPLLSWRVRLLPYLEQNALYKQFKLDEPWDSPNNKPLLAKMPPVFAAPSQKSPAGTTTYLGVKGKEFVFKPNAKEGIKIQDIADGSSNTILIVETGDDLAIEWSKPGDWTPDEKDRMKGLLGHYPQGVLAGFGDGSVRTVAKTVDPKNFYRMLAENDGEVVTWP